MTKKEKNNQKQLKQSNEEAAGQIAKDLWYLCIFKTDCLLPQPTGSFINLHSVQIQRKMVS